MVNYTGLGRRSVRIPGLPRPRYLAGMANTQPLAFFLGRRQSEDGINVWNHWIMKAKHPPGKRKKRGES
jgi:hypothetical protein